MFLDRSLKHTCQRAVVIAALVGASLAPLSAQADDENFLGWAKDGSWFVFETSTGPNDFLELHFCKVGIGPVTSWPVELDEFEAERFGGYDCVRLTDINRAPAGWRGSLKLPASSMKRPGGGALVLDELSPDGQPPGLTVLVSKERVVCEGHWVNHESTIDAVYWHPSGRSLVAKVDGRLLACRLPNKKDADPKSPPDRKARRRN